MRRSQPTCTSDSLMHQQCDCDFGLAGDEIEPGLGSNREGFVLRTTFRSWMLWDISCVGDAKPSHPLRRATIGAYR
jgi:hypothetical protein